MGPEKSNPLGKKLDKVSKRERLAELRGDEAETITGPNYEVVRSGTELQSRLADRLNKALQNDEKFLQIGEAEPNEEQVEIVPETKVDESFFKSLPKSREFVVYANAHDLAIPADNLRPIVGTNVLIVFDSAHRLIEELSYEQKTTDREVA